MKKILSLLFIAAILAGCASKQKVTYFQDIHDGDTKTVTTLVKKIKMMPGDKISIVVNSKTPELVTRYNLVTPSTSFGGVSGGGGNNVSAYTIDSNGFIDFPEVGKIFVEGKTREEIATLIRETLINGGHVLDPTVTVEYVNQELSVLGEINRPGKISIDRDYITILDAIAMAGDLRIEGKRADVTVLRQEGDTQKVYEIDLTSSDAIYSSPAYYLQQNDIVYVKPNKKRIGQADINSNTVRSTSFWMSLASFVMVLVTFIDNR